LVLGAWFSFNRYDYKVKLRSDSLRSLRKTLRPLREKHFLK